MRFLMEPQCSHPSLGLASWHKVGDGSVNAEHGD